MVRPRSRQGFTLIEMMLVVTVIGVLSALILPGIGEVMADNRQAAASENLVRLHRMVRARVNQMGLAHLMVFSADASSGHGDITVYEGMNNRCQSTPWANVFDANAAAKGHLPVAALDMLDFNDLPSNYTGGTDDRLRQVITVRAASLVAGAPQPLNVVNLCIQPNGMTFMSTVAGNWTFQAQSSPVLFTFRRTMAGSQHGVNRNVLFPVGGNARLRI